QDDNGFGEKYVPCESLWVYNLELQEWTRHEVPGLNMIGRSGSGCFSHRGKMYVWGGFPNHTKEVYCLDTAGISWQTIESEGEVPEYRDKFVSWQYHERLIVFGGFGPQPVDATKDSWVLDPSSIVQGLPQSRGWNNDLFEYNIETNRWRKPKTKGPVPCPRASHAGAIIGHRGFIFGGRFKMTVLKFVLAGYLYRQTCCFFCKKRRSDMHCIDLITFTWSGRLTIQGPIPEGRSWHSLTTIGPHHLLLCGGFNTTCKPLDDMWLFDTNQLLWRRLEWDLPTPRLWHTTVAGLHLGEVVIFGGCTNNILDNHEDTVYTNSLLHISVTAKPLLRICYETIWQHIDRFRQEIENLPPCLKRRALKMTSPSFVMFKM
ncbi:putative kelch domain-containing protein 2-like, partial [Apostichopus japonicus]